MLYKLKSIRFLYFLNYLPAIGVVYFIFTFGVNVPFGDQWTLVSLFDKTFHGKLNFLDIYAQHNEHRIFFPKLIFILLAFVSKWNIYYELICGWIFALLVLAILLRICQNQYLEINGKFLDKITRVVPDFIIACLVFSLSQYENWIWGFQLSWFLINLCLVVSVFILFKNHQTNRQIWLLASLPCFIASFSSAHGLLTWFALIPQLQGTRISQTQKITRLVLWLALAAITIWIYLIGYQSLSGGRHPSLLFFLKEPINSILYFLTFLGSAIMPAKEVAPIVGIALLLVFLILTVLITGNQSSLQDRSQHLPWVSLSLFSLLFAALTTLGRAGFGVEQAMASRYRTSSVLFVIAIIQLFRLFVYSLQYRQDRANFIFRQPIKKYILFISTFIVTLGFVLTSSIVESHSLLSYGPELRIHRGEIGKFCLEFSAYIDDRATACNTASFYPSFTMVKEQSVPILKELGFRQFPAHVSFTVQNSSPLSYLSGIDTIEDPETVKIHRGDSIQLSGWVFEDGATSQPEFILISYDNQHSYLEIAPIYLERLDVVQMFNYSGDPRIGWQVNLQANSLPLGEGCLTAWIYKDHGFIQLVDKYKVQVFD
jgi:hypothetical protein